MRQKISFLAAMYNEENRIGAVLDHAVRWADEVVLIDKSSTDNSAEIAKGYGPKVKVFKVPYSSQSSTDEKAHCELTTHDWIFVGTCSEIPTRKLIEKSRKLVEQKGELLELIYVPRKAYSFGIHSMNLPWNIAYFPFLFNKNKINFTGIIHDHFRPNDPSKTAIIGYEPDCCVHHLTHISARRFIEVHMQYAEKEAELSQNPQKSITEWYHIIGQSLPRIIKIGDNWSGMFAAWAICNLMNVLFTWERSRGVNVIALYRKMTSDLLEKEWGGIAHYDSIKSGELIPESCSSNIQSPKQNNDMTATFYVASVISRFLFFVKNPVELLQSSGNSIKSCAKFVYEKICYALRRIRNTF